MMPRVPDNSIWWAISEGSYDICHDKGTYDAIILRPDDANGARQFYMMDSLKYIQFKNL